jgi:hypothetical protein
MPVSDFETYGIIQLVFTNWDEVYVYGDGELVDILAEDDRDTGVVWPVVDEYLLAAKTNRLYDLDEDFNDDVLPDEFPDIPECFLRERVEE